MRLSRARMGLKTKRTPVCRTRSAAASAVSFNSRTRRKRQSWQSNPIRWETLAGTRAEFLQRQVLKGCQQFRLVLQKQVPVCPLEVDDVFMRLQFSL